MEVRFVQVASQPPSVSACSRERLGRVDPRVLFVMSSIGTLHVMWIISRVLQLFYVRTSLSLRLHPFGKTYLQIARSEEPSRSFRSAPGSSPFLNVPIPDMSARDPEETVRQEETRLRIIHPTTEDIPGCMSLLDDFLSCNSARLLPPRVLE